jgi:tetratricopeptide (TPR) repeat protein
MDKKMGKDILARINSLIKESGRYKVFISMSIAILVLILVLTVIQQSWIKKEKNAINSIINNSGNEIKHVKAEPLKESKKLLAKNVKKESKNVNVKEERKNFKKENKSSLSASALRARKKAIFNIEKKMKGADMYFEYGQYEKAVAIYEELTDESSASEWSDKVFNRLAECYYNLGDLEGALEAYRKVCNNFLNSPYSLNAQLKMGECLILMGNFEEARRVLYTLVGQEVKYKKAEDKSKVIEAYYKIADSYVEQAKTHLSKNNKGNLH